MGELVHPTINLVSPKSECFDIQIRSCICFTPWQTFTMKIFAKVINGFTLLTIFARSFITYVWQDPKYFSEAWKCNSKNLNSEQEMLRMQLKGNVFQQNRCFKWNIASLIAIESNWMKQIFFHKYHKEVVIIEKDKRSATSLLTP